jgi:hypothetical protein
MEHPARAPTRTFVVAFDGHVTSVGTYCRDRIQGNGGARVVEGPHAFKTVIDKFYRRQRAIREAFRNLSDGQCR